MNIIGLVIQLISGAVGGNVAGALMKNFSLGPLGNSIAGIVGGGIGGQILSALLSGGTAAAGGAAAGGSVIGSIAGGGPDTRRPTGTYGLVGSTHCGSGWSAPGDGQHCRQCIAGRGG